MNNLKTPNLLIIGAMKSYTTSFCFDLNRHPDVFIPESKEINCLRCAESSIRTVKNAYNFYYRKRREKYLGEGSTSYTKFPCKPPVATLARRCLLPETKIIYLTRDPVERIKRHIAHEIGNGRSLEVPFCLVNDPQFIALSAYKMQLSFWHQSYPSSQILTLYSDDYGRDRLDLLRKSFAFLELDMNMSRFADDSGSYLNRGLTKHTAYKSPLRFVLHSSFYPKLRERLPKKLRRWGAEKLLPLAGAPNRVEFSECVETGIRDAIYELNQLERPKKSAVVDVLQVHLAKRIYAS